MPCAQSSLWEQVMRSVSLGCRSPSLAVRIGQSCRGLPVTSIPSATNAKEEMQIASFTYTGLQAGWKAQVTAPLLPCNAMRCPLLLPLNAAFCCCPWMLLSSAALCPLLPLAASPPPVAQPF